MRIFVKMDDIMSCTFYTASKTKVNPLPAICKLINPFYIEIPIKLHSGWDAIWIIRRSSPKWWCICKAFPMKCNIFFQQSKEMLLWFSKTAMWTWLASRFTLHSSQTLNMEITRASLSLNLILNIASDLPFCRNGKTYRKWQVEIP